MKVVACATNGREAYELCGEYKKVIVVKATDLVELGFASCHRTTFGHFLKGIWDESYLWKAMKDIVSATVQKVTKQTIEPIQSQAGVP